MSTAVSKKTMRHKLLNELEALATEMNVKIQALVVEGAHDRKTLRFLGCRMPILLCSSYSQETLADIITQKFCNVVILTDFDEQGKLINTKMSKLLERKGIAENQFYRKRIKKIA